MLPSVFGVWNSQLSVPAPRDWLPPYVHVPVSGTVQDALPMVIVSMAPLKANRPLDPVSPIAPAFITPEANMIRKVT